ncbi:unnamed protein product [Lepeophtheirus salmonis]|uniref:(salmon louse) hypothetical protein n=1 Tax=Lepeophtheirus salmonis TaxID=72036 RepID=A0A7R8CGT7_LEPSM|nr:unnamed protein product [Lepeophtheirus salmonis]CAF2818561.1 unnamed protein product [Lepeophtheirus salmonis]
MPTIKDNIVQRGRDEISFTKDGRSSRQLLTQAQRSRYEIKELQKVEILVRLTKKLTEKWKCSLYKVLESTFTRRAEKWCKPAEDPLNAQYFGLVEEFELIISGLEC